MSIGVWFRASWTNSTQNWNRPQVGMNVKKKQNLWKHHLDVEALPSSLLLEGFYGYQTRNHVRSGKHWQTNHGPLYSIVPTIYHQPKTPQRSLKKKHGFFFFSFTSWSCVIILAKLFHLEFPSKKKHIFSRGFNPKLDVSKNNGTPKWMVYNGKPYSNGWFGGTTIFGNTQLPQIPRKNSSTSILGSNSTKDIQAVAIVLGPEAEPYPTRWDSPV